MADILPLPGATFRAEPAKATAPEDALTGALNAGLLDVAIVGRTISGEITVFGSQPDSDAVIGLLTRGISFLANAQQIDLDEDEE